MKTGDIASGLALIGLGAYIVFEAWDWPFLGPDGPGPGFMPIGVGAALIALCAWQVVAALGEAPAGAEKGSGTDWSRVRRALAAWAAFAVAIALIKPLGFFLSFVLLGFFLVVVMYRRSVATGLAVSLFSAAGFYLVFAVALRIRLPAGPWGF